MKIKDVVENEDGSATLMIEDMSKDEVQMLLEIGLQKVLMDQVERELQKYKIPALLREKDGD